MYFMLWIFFSVVPCWAQADSIRPISKETPLVKTWEVDTQLMEEIKNRKEFDYNQAISEDSWWDEFTRWINLQWNKLLEAIFGNIEPQSFVYFLTQILPYIIVIGVLIFIVWLFIKLNPGQNVLAKAEKNQLYFSKEEELVKTKDVAKLKEEALLNKNYRLAVRYWYLQTLQRLDQLAIIHYEFEKTNADYLKELKSSSFSEAFQHSTNYYNHAWYGGFEVNELQFQKINRLFTQFHQQINQQHG